MNLKVMLDPGALMPTRAHEADAGLDLYTPRAVEVPGYGSALIDTGVHVQIPEGFVGMVKSKSGLNVKRGLTCEGVIDSGYTGSIMVKLNNQGFGCQNFWAGDKIAQLVIVPCLKADPYLVEYLEETERGDGGFGSTGR